MTSKSLSRRSNQKLETVSHYSIRQTRLAKTTSAKCLRTVTRVDSLQMKSDVR